MQPKMDKNTQHEKLFIETASQLSFYTVVSAKGRGCTHVYIDEAAYIKNMDEEWRALHPVLSCGGRCYVLSTVNGVGNWFEKTYHGAVKKENAFHVYDAHYSEHPDFQDEEHLAKIKKNLGEKMFLVEMEKCFLTEWKPTEPPKLADQLLAIASKRRLSEEERSALFEAACRLRYETKEVEAKMKVLELEEKKLRTLKHEIEVLQLQSNLSSPST
jgi:phage FluMu gp28-like protein